MPKSMRMDSIIGKTYTWGNKTIVFSKNGIVTTPWAGGNYVWLDSHTITATWQSIGHILVFDSTYTEFTSTRVGDKSVVKGKLTLMNSSSKIISMTLDYKDSVGELCLLSKKYNIDKSSQRENPGPNDSNHCHPYSLLYGALFKAQCNDALTFCEIGIAEGRSLLMWNEYLPNAQIYGFEKWQKWLDNWSQNYSDKKNVHVSYTDVSNPTDIHASFQNTGVQFDCIIDDSSHFFYDMIRIIHCALAYLKPGGMIIVEDIRKAFDESWFYDELKGILDEFQTVFFIDLDHSRRNSGIVNNDKVLILIKKGEPIFNYKLV